ncbi:MAG: biopolymer transporter ExbD [Chitinophagales bacterium]
MAEITNSDGGQHRSLTKRPTKKQGNIRVDMTPMVDLGFLLITFFMLTMVLSQAKYYVGLDKRIENPPSDVAECQVMNVLIDSFDRVYVYDGLQVANLQKTTFDGENGIRKLILEKSRKVRSECPLTSKGEKRQAVCLIKLLPGAKYKNMVDILDEMEITQTQCYSMQDPSAVEAEAVKQQELLAVVK